MQQTFTSKIEYLDKLKLHHIIVEEAILKKFADKDAKSVYNQRFEITINGVKWKGGTVSLGDKTAYITFSKQRMKEAQVELGDTVEVTLVKDTSKYGFDVPEEFTSALELDQEAKRRFDQLRMGMQRNIIYMVIQYKSSDKRIEKSLFFLENLKRSKEGETTMRNILGKELP